MQAARKRSGTEYIMARAKQREVYGNGSVTPEKRNGEVVRDAWRVCVSLGMETYIDKDGNERKRRRKVQKTVHGTLAEARKVCKQMVEQYEHVDLATAKDDFSAVASAWLDMARAANLCGKDQMRKYERHFDYMAKHLGGKPIIEVKKTDIEKALASVKKEHRLSNTTMHKIFQQTNRLFEYAVDSDICVRNPCRAIVAPQGRQGEFPPLPNRRGGSEAALLPRPRREGGIQGIQSEGAASGGMGPRVYPLVASRVVAHQRNHRRALIARHWMPAR